jgi:hypothetical protein
MRVKSQQSLKKDRNRSFSRFDTNLVKRERTITERERGKRHSEKCQLGPRETEPSSHVQPNAVLSCPTRSLSTSPTRRGPTRCRPTHQHGTVNYTGILPSELLLRVSDKGMGKIEEKLKSWRKLSTTKDLRARK